MPKNQKGLSILELLITISIIGLISLVSIPALKNFNTGQDLENSVSDFKNALRTTQSKAITGVKCPNKKPSVKWDFLISQTNSQTSYKIIPYCDNGGGSTSADPTTASYNLTNNIKIDSVASASPNGNCLTTDTDFTFQGRSLTLTCPQTAPAFPTTPASLSLTFINSASQKKNACYKHRRHNK